MPDPHRIEGELVEILKQRRYNPLLSRIAENNPGVDRNQIVGNLAKQTAESAFRTDAFVGEVKVEELRGPVDLYRANDGLSHDTALTLGGFWCDRPLVENIWAATRRFSATGRQSVFFDFYRSALFIDRKWNLMSDIARMRIPAGNALPVLRGRSTWRALRIKPGIRSEKDVYERLNWMPIPGLYQYMIPGCDPSGHPDARARWRRMVWAFNDMWICKVNRQSGTWPIA